MESADAIMLNAAPHLLTRRYTTEAGLEARMGEKHRGVSLETVTRKLEDQEKVIDATGDIDGTLEAFRDTLRRFANGEGQLDSLLQKAGLNATTDELRPVVAYAARALKNAGEEREVFSVQSLPDGRRYVEVDTDQQLFDGLTRNEMKNVARNYILGKMRGRILGNRVQAIAIRKTAKEYAMPAILRYSRP